MVLDSIECVRRIARYLEVEPGNLYMSKNNIIASDSILSNQSVEGFSTIVRHLADNSRSPYYRRGNTREEQALTIQWLEYVALNVNYADCPTHSRKILRELNEALIGNTYFTGTEMAFADVALYYLLYGIVKDLNHQEKAQHVNISRWFDNIQRYSRLRRDLEQINFDLLHLYL